MKALATIMGIIAPATAFAASDATGKVFRKRPLDHALPRVLRLCSGCSVHTSFDNAVRNDQRTFLSSERGAACR